MNILITGATGFIASHITSHLIQNGYQVTCCVQNTELASNLFPQAKIIACDFNRDTQIETWLSRVQDIDVVINCVGILQHPDINKIWNIHFHTPKALFDACVQTNVSNVIQLSALGIETSSVEFAKSKLAADNYLSSLKMKSFIIRPSLVYASGSYGGTSLFRGLAALPFIPVPDQGMQTFQPVHVNDLSKAILNLVEVQAPKLDVSSYQAQTLHFASEQKVTLRDILIHLRAWLGFHPTKMISISDKLMQMITKTCDYLPNTTINRTSYQMLMQDNATSKAEIEKTAKFTGVTPRDFLTGLYNAPSSVQDRWHAKLYFLKPLLQFSIAFVWLFTAICSTFLYPETKSLALLEQIGVNTFWQPILLYGASGVDALLGFAVLFKYRVKLFGILQIFVILLYTSIITWKLPSLWLEPFAPIVKNIPFLVAILIYIAINEER